MIEGLNQFFFQSNFMPHVHCYLAKPSLVWTMFITDMLIGLAYLGISLTLYILVKRVQIQFSAILLCFGVFIGACGATHFMEVWTLWHPHYWVSAAVKILTAVASVGTGIYLIQLRHPIVNVIETARQAEAHRIKLEEYTFDLIARENTLRSFFDSAPMMMGIADIEGDDIRHVSDNHSASEFFGKSAQELQGRLASELGVPKADIQLWVNHYVQSELKNRPVRFEYQHHSSGELHWLLVSVSFIGKTPHNYSRFSYIVQDITEMRLNEIQLRESQRLLERRVQERTAELQIKSDALENSLNGFDIINSDGKFIYANRAYLKMWGYETLDEIIGTSPGTHCADPAIPQQIIHTLKEKRECNIEFTARRKDGSIFDVDMWARLAYDADGHELYPTTSIDITTRKRAEEKIKASEFKYKSLFMNMTEEVHYWELVRNDSGQIITWKLIDANPPALDTWRKKLDDVLNKTTDEIFGSGPTEHYLEVIQKIFSDGKPYTFEDYFPNLDRYFRFTAIPVGEFFFTTGSDITKIKKAEIQLKESEERLRLALEAAHLGVYERDLPPKNVTWSLQAKDLLGYSFGAVEENYGSFLARVHPEDRERIQKAALQTFLENRSIDIDFRFNRPDGQVRWLHAYGKVICNTNGSPVREIGILQDVTDRKQAEKEVAQEREFLSRLIEKLPVMITIYNPKLHLFRFNESFQNTLGWNEQDTKSKNLMELTYPDPQIRKLAAAHMDSGEAGWQEFQVTSKSGSLIPSLWANIYLSDDRQVGIGIDLREQKRARETLKLERDKFEAVINNMDVGIGLSTPLGQMVSLNPAGLKIHGFQSETEMFSKLDRYRDEFELQYPDGRIMPFDEWPIRRAIRGEFVRNYDLKLVKRSSGKVKYLSYSVLPIRESKGQFVFFVFNILDLTDRKLAEDALRRSEAELRAYAEAMPQMAFIADAQGNIRFYNRRHYEYFGVHTGETENWDWKYKELQHPDDLQRTIDTWTESVTKGTPYQIEYRLRRYDGEYRWHLARAEPFRDENGKIIRWFGTNTDIHDQKEAMRQLEEALQIRDDFISIASHELRTPITSMKMQTQIMKRSILKNDPTAFSPDRIYSLVEQSDRQLDRLTRLIEDMLDISRISSGKLTINSEQVDFCEMTRDVVDRYRPQFEQAHIPLELDCENNVIGFWDRFRLEQVITNLLTNSIRYGAGNPVYIQVCTEDNFAVLRIRDQGIGIPKESQERIFQRYERAISKNEVSGLGLGLFIVQQILQMHGGSISVESDVGKGSTFTVRLPLKKQQRENSVA